MGSSTDNKLVVLSVEASLFPSPPTSTFSSGFLYSSLIFSLTTVTVTAVEKKFFITCTDGVSNKILCPL